MSIAPPVEALGISIAPRGSLSAAVLEALSDPDADVRVLRAADAACARTRDILHDGDIQLAPFLLYANFYGSLPGLSAEREWDPGLIAARRLLESPFEAALRRSVPPQRLPEARREAVASALFALTGDDSGPSLARYVAREATQEQVREFLVHRSVYTLREADAHSWAIPRLTGPAKAALVEIQSDEYGGGRPERVHAELFATAMRGAGLCDDYGFYIDAVPAITLASLNMMSMFGPNRRLTGAIVGHLAAFEMTSAIPSRLYGEGMRRLGFSADVTGYFDEHVEADAVHEQIAGRDLAGGLVEQHPDLLPDVLFGAGACLAVDGMVGRHILDCWERGVSSLRPGGLG